MNATTKYLATFGRVVIGAVFLMSGLGKVGGYAGVTAAITKAGLPGAKSARGNPSLHGRNYRRVDRNWPDTHGCLSSYGIFWRIYWHHLSHGAAGDFDHHIARIFDAGIRYRFAPDIFLAVPA